MKTIRKKRNEPIKHKKKRDIFWTKQNKTKVVRKNPWWTHPWYIARFIIPENGRELWNGQSIQLNGASCLWCVRTKATNLLSHQSKHNIWYKNTLSFPLLHSGVRLSFYLQCLPRKGLGSVRSADSDTIYTISIIPFVHKQLFRSFRTFFEEHIVFIESSNYLSVIFIFLLVHSDYMYVNGKYSTDFFKIMIYIYKS